MHLETQKFAVAAAGTMGLVYVICATFVALFPDFSSQLMSWLTHVVNLDSREVTWGAFFGGLIQILIYTYVIAGIFAWLHNRFVKP